MLSPHGLSSTVASEQLNFLRAGSGGPNTQREREGEREKKKKEEGKGEEEGEGEEVEEWEEGKEEE